MLKPCLTALARHATIAVLVISSSLLGACSSGPKDPDSGKSAAKLYEEARDEASAGAYDRAIKLYEKLEGVAAGTLLSQQAQLEQAYLHNRQQQKAQALAILERFIKLHPSSPALDYAYYLQGVVNFNDELGLFGETAKVDLAERDQQASKDAYQSFRQVVERFPDSKYAPDARVRMNYIVNALAAYEVHVARYYYKRGAYVAAANRAQQAVVDFRDSPATEGALYLLASSYDRLGLTDLRDDALRVLKRNYPDSALLTRGVGQVDDKRWGLW